MQYMQTKWESNEREMKEIQNSFNRVKNESH